MHRALLVSALAALVSCSSSSSGGAGDPAPGAAADGATDTAAAADADRGGIDDSAPLADDTAAAPPCGKNVGDVLCDLDLQGYQRNETSGLATVAPFTTFKTRDVLAAGTTPYVFVFNSAYW